MYTNVVHTSNKEQEQDNSLSIDAISRPFSKYTAEYTSNVITDIGWFPGERIPVLEVD